MNISGDLCSVVVLRKQMLCRLELVLHAILMLFSLSRSELFESKKERAENLFRKKVEAVYRKVTPCLQLTSTFNSQQMAYNDDLEDHYGEILAVTGQYRGLKPHTGSGNYSGKKIFLIDCNLQSIVTSFEFRCVALFLNMLTATTLCEF